LVLNITINYSSAEDEVGGGSSLALARISRMLVGALTWCSNVAMISVCSLMLVTT